MLLLLNKILPFFVLPLGLGLLLVLAGLFFRRRFFTAMGIAVLWIFSLPFVADTLLATLEGEPRRVPVSMVKEADAVVVLSGMLRKVENAQLYEWSEAVDRFESGVELWMAGKAPYLVFTGGWVPWNPEKRPEGEVLAIRARRLGVDESAILVTGKVGNTLAEAAAVFELMQHENITFTDQTPRIILVTSAFHMPRAAALFERAGLDVQRFPVAFYQRASSRLSPMSFLPCPGALNNSHKILREWLGIIFYRITDKI